ncbi:LCP family protein [Micrococcus lylae]|uniref:LCP family protein n=1 Tax=Micrococcus lylae TaxID=1273 RepID=UPI002155A904|nr:LCP family protein [Micrococcus lylae]WIK82332.1 LCP family protein [Micrococcus lylae]
MNAQLTDWPETLGTDRDPVRDPLTATAPERTKRSAILLLLTLLVPGGAQVVAGNRRLGRAALRVTMTVWAALLVCLLISFVARGWLLNMLANSVVLGVLALVLLVLALAWLVLWVDTFRLLKVGQLAPGAKILTVAATILALVVTTGGLTYGAYLTNAGRTSTGKIFGDGPKVPSQDGRYNFLVMGGDAGEGRVGLRPDSIHVVSINARTGATMLFSIPRNFQNAQFTEDSPLWDVYPDGYNCGDECIINALYVDVTNNHSDLYPGAEDPGAEAMVDAAGGILGLDMSGYVLVDMGGFSQLIDAMGGITLTSGGWVTHRGERPDGQWGNAWWGPGTHELDGKNALAFARSRKYSTDYSRIRRQQCMQQAMLQQFSPRTVLARFEEIMDAGEQIVETNLPQSQLGTFVDLGEKARGKKMQRLTIGAPDFGDAGDKFSTFPDFEQIHERVGQMMEEDGTPVEPGAEAQSPAGAALPLLTGTAPEPSVAPEVDEDDPDTWPAAPTDYEGMEITEETLMQWEDAGLEKALLHASSTNHLCAPGR